MKYLKHIFAILCAALMLSSCGNIREIHLTSYKVASFSPVGLRGVDLVLDLGVDNPALQFTVDDVTATVTRNGQPLGTFVNTEPVTVKRKSVAVYSVPGQVRLSDGVSLLYVMSLARNFNMAEYRISYSAKVTIKGGGHVTLSKDDVPLKELFEE